MKYLVVGGYAVALHGHPRYTKDRDIWISADTENAENLLRALKDFGFSFPNLNVDDFTAPDALFKGISTASFAKAKPEAIRAFFLT
ncbi:MAG: hypothetical protein LBR86_08250 [Tannerella sp.]|nr:hypothetical protein [Tannerella sp.]